MEIYRPILADRKESPKPPALNADLAKLAMLLGVTIEELERQIADAKRKAKDEC